MAVLPSSRIAQIEWFEERLAAWLANAAAIGLTPSQVTQLQGEIAAARGDYIAAQQARNDSKSATVSFYASSDALADDGRDLIATIKAYAEATNDPNVYALANVPPPADPGPVPAPGTPYALRVGLQGDGTVELKWKCDNPAGGGKVVYEIFRAGSGGTLAFLANAGERAFLDDSVPSNGSPLTYQITAVRGTDRGAAAQFLVNFGSGGNVQQGSGESGGQLGLAA